MKKKRYISAVLLCLYIITVALLCFIKTESLPSVELTIFGIPTDKLVHAVMFFPFPVLTYMTFQPDEGGIWRSLPIIIAAVALGLGLAAGTERIQTLLGYRTGDVKDLMSDMVGILCGAVLILIYVVFIKNDRLK